ncbi:MAG: hypothetical protein NVS9B9_10280 [Ktedonobacteraceae bacterium]
MLEQTQKEYGLTQTPQAQEAQRAARDQSNELHAMQYGIAPRGGDVLQGSSAEQEAARMRETNSWTEHKPPEPPKAKRGRPPGQGKAGRKRG